MATLIPSRNGCLPRMTGGEKRFSERLEQKLEDDYLLWYDVPVGLKQLRPDFMVFHPRRGLLVLEVKDWKPDTIQHADKTQFTLLTARGLVKENNPLLQARGYATEVYMQLQKDPALRQPHQGPHAGKLVMPWAYGVVLTNISRRQFTDGQLDAVIPAHLAICQDEIYDSVEAEDFQERLWAMFPYVFPTALTLPQIDRVRWHLFPEIRVASGEGQFGLFDRADAPAPKPLEIPDLIRVMDAQQEQLARSLGDEHRIIHGVAGSGKTMILGFRAMQLARELSKPILVLCYNKTLAARLDQLIGERGLGEKVQVYNFHKWCHQMLSVYHVEKPAQGSRDFFAQMVQRVIDGVDQGQIPRFQYGAVLIDEGHDFEPDWYRLIVQMIDPSTNSLLVLYDDAQNINGRTDRRKFTWKSLGVQARGRTTILKLNYRNTLEILSVARSFASELLLAHDGDDDGVPLIAPESAGRRGAVPELIRVGDEDEMAVVVAQIRDEQARGRPLDDIAVLYQHDRQGRALRDALQGAGIGCKLANGDGKSTLFLVKDSVKIVSMHSSKGLEFPLVIIPGLGEMPAPDGDEAAAARLLYVAMTRATERLLLIHRHDSVFSKRIRDSINEVQAQLDSAA